MNTFAVDLDRIAVFVWTDGAVERIPFRTKKQADKKIKELFAAGYTFDREWWYREQQRKARLRVEAYHLCNALCHKLDWRLAPEREARIRRVLERARARLARREAL